MKNIYKIGENIYITNESDIKENDYVIVSCSEVNIEEVRIVTGYYNEQFLFDDKSQIHMDYCKKIILTTNEELIKNGVQSIDDNFLKWFVNNPSCEYVEIESNYRVKSGTIEEHKQGVAGYEYYEYKIIIPQEELKQVPIENDEFCYYSGLPSPIAYKENMNPFELPNVLPDDVFNKSLEELAEKEYPKLIVENPSCNGYNEPNHIDINEECRNSFMEGVKSDEAKEYWFDVFKKNKEKWNKVTEDTPPSNVELLVKSPNGIIHLSRWRESYNIFGCQAKSESIVGWKWKKI
jgi:hypothetical protein